MWQLSIKNPKVFLQTPKAKIVSDNKEMDTHLILDTGFQISYILKKLAEEMKHAVIQKKKKSYAFTFWVNLNKRVEA